jgi:hypothetical protein
VTTCWQPTALSSCCASSKGAPPLLYHQWRSNSKTMQAVLPSMYNVCSSTAPQKASRDKGNVMHSTGQDTYLVPLPAPCHSASSSATALSLTGAAGSSRRPRATVQQQLAQAAWLQAARAVSLCVQDHQEVHPQAPAALMSCLPS